MTTPDQPEKLGTTPVSQLIVEACRIAYDESDPAHRLGLDEAARELCVRTARDPEDDLKAARAVLEAVGDRASVDFGTDFSGDVYRGRAMLRLLVSVEVDVPGYLLAHPHPASTRRHVLDDLHTQALTEMRTALEQIDWVTRTRYVTPTAQLIWKG